MEILLYAVNWAIGGTVAYWVIRLAVTHAIRDAAPKVREV